MISSCMSYGLKFRRIFVRSMALAELSFENLALKKLPVDRSKVSGSRRVEGACFSIVDPTPVDEPELVAASSEALALLDIDVTKTESKDLALYFSGNKIFPTSTTAAHCYCGHQFGYFSGQLGDGTVIYLGDKINNQNERIEVQLKGAGKTPYSRGSDGRKVLRSSIREFLASEAMHHLGVPTTRAGTCVTSSSTVVRDIFYDGHPIHEKCSIVSRIAPTFLRFGSFEIFKDTDPETGRDGPSSEDEHLPMLKTMIQYTAENFYPVIWCENRDNFEGMVQKMYLEIVDKTAFLVAKWQCVGFCHGVLNTDNMSILGLTIDYGPYGFLDRYDPKHCCNGSDDGARYSYEKQPEICKWNCKKLLEMFEKVASAEHLYKSFIQFDDFYEKYYMENMYKKFGVKPKSVDDDKNFFKLFFDAMKKTGADFTNSFRVLSKLNFSDASLADVKSSLLSYCTNADELRKQYQPNVSAHELQMVRSLAETNPQLLSLFGGKRLLGELRKMEIYEDYKDLTDESKRKTDDEVWQKWLSDVYLKRLRDDYPGGHDCEEWTNRLETMNKNNPKFILRNYLLQRAIEKAERGNYSEVQRLLDLSKTPFDEEAMLESVVKEECSTEAAGSTKDELENNILSKYFKKPSVKDLSIRVT